jgi:hypothetical protein
MVPKLTVERLSDDNYYTWAPRFEGLLIMYGLEATITDVNAAAALMAKAKALMAIYVEDQFVGVVKNCETAKEAWDTLAGIFATRSNARRLQLKTEISTLRMEGNETVSAYSTRASKLRDQLLAAGQPLNEDELVLCMLNGLPTEYDMVKTVLTSGKRSYRMADVLPDLLMTESRMSKGKVKSTEAQAFYASMKKLKCWTCGKEGHIQRHCPKKEQKADDNSENSSGSSSDSDTESRKKKLDKKIKKKKGKAYTMTAIANPAYSM